MQFWNISGCALLVCRQEFKWVYLARKVLSLVSIWLVFVFSVCLAWIWIWNEKSNLFLFLTLKSVIVLLNVVCHGFVEHIDCDVKWVPCSC